MPSFGLNFGENIVADLWINKADGKLKTREGHVDTWDTGQATLSYKQLRAAMVKVYCPSLPMKICEEIIRTAKPDEESIQAANRWLKQHSNTLSRVLWGLEELETENEG